LNQQMGGFKEMTSLPSALFVVDTIKENIALAEARRVGIPVVAIVDTNCNPDEIDYLIPANDDAIKAINLICNKLADAVIEAKSSGMVSPTEEAAEVEEGGLGEPGVAETTEALETAEPVTSTSGDEQTKEGN